MVASHPSVPIASLCPVARRTQVVTVTIEDDGRATVQLVPALALVAYPEPTRNGQYGGEPEITYDVLVSVEPEVGGIMPASEAFGDVINMAFEVVPFAWPRRFDEERLAPIVARFTEKARQKVALRKAG
jgi:hypothetical protein